MQNNKTLQVPQNNDNKSFNRTNSDIKNTGGDVNSAFKNQVNMAKQKNLKQMLGQC